jgi:phospholipase C
MRTFVLLCGTLAALMLAAPAAQAKQGLRGIDHIVVIYEENHSFDNLYGGWEKVDGLKPVAQVNQAGAAYKCLLQNDVNLASPPLTPSCTGEAFASHFPNAPFRIEDFIGPRTPRVRRRARTRPTAS